MTEPEPLTIEEWREYAFSLMRDLSKCSAAKNGFREQWDAANQEIERLTSVVERYRRVNPFCRTCYPFSADEWDRDHAAQPIETEVPND